VYLSYSINIVLKITSKIYLTRRMIAIYFFLIQITDILAKQAQQKSFEK